MSSVWTSWSLLSGVGLASLSSLKLLKVSYDSSSFWFTCKLLFVVYYGDIYLTSSLYSASDYYAILDGKSNRKTYIYAELSKQFSKFIFFIFMSLNSSKSRLGWWGQLLLLLTPSSQWFLFSSSSLQTYSLELPFFFLSQLALQSYVLLQQTLFDCDLLSVKNFASWIEFSVPRHILNSIVCEMALILK